MKISELTTEQAADVLCELTPYIANITGDKALLDELGKKFDSKGKSVPPKEAAERLDRMAQELGELIDQEETLLRNIMESDKKR